MDCETNDWTACLLTTILIIAGWIFLLARLSTMMGA